MLITEKRVEKALRLLAQTDDEVAVAKANEMRTEFMAKTAEALAFKQAEGSSAEERRQLSRLTDEVQTKHEEHFKAVAEHARLRARREREMIILDLWRTQQADQRRGNV